MRELQDESRAWPRYELIGGELLVTPAPGWAHQGIVGCFYLALAEYLSREPIGEVYFSPADIELELGTITQPDVFVVPVGGATLSAEPRWTDIKSLVLAIEVISPSSVRTDRTTKREYYLNIGVPDYVAVDPEARSVEHWPPEHDGPTILRSEFVWSPAGAGQPLIVSLPTLFDRVAAQLKRIGVVT